MKNYPLKLENVFVLLICCRILVLVWHVYRCLIIVCHCFMIRIAVLVHPWYVSLSSSCFPFCLSSSIRKDSQFPCPNLLFANIGMKMWRSDLYPIALAISPTAYNGSLSYLKKGHHDPFRFAAAACNRANSCLDSFKAFSSSSFAFEIRSRFMRRFKSSFCFGKPPLAIMSNCSANILDFCSSSLISAKSKLLEIFEKDWIAIAINKVRISG